MKRFARIVAWLLVALTGAAFLVTELPQGPGDRIVLAAIALVALAILVLIWRSAYRTIIMIAVAMLAVGATMVVFVRPVTRTIFPGDSMGLGGLLVLVVGVGLLAWGTFTALPAAWARRAERRGNTVGPGVRVIVAIPSVLVVAALAMLLASERERRKPQMALAEVPFFGDRADAPPLANRGNARFAAAAFDETGALLVTAAGDLAPGIQVWDARTGAHIADIAASIPQRPGDLGLLLDTRRERLLAANKGYALFELRTGREVARLPVSEPFSSMELAGLAGDGGTALFVAPDRFELWGLDPPQVLRSSPHPVPAPIQGRIWSWSPDRRALAVAYRPASAPQDGPRLFVVDTTSLEARELTLPAALAGNNVSALAFSPDGRWLAVAGWKASMLYDRRADTWPATIGRPRDPGSAAWWKIQFTADSRTLVAIDGSHRVSAYDIATGALAGQSEKARDSSMESVEVSRDGSRIVVVGTATDTFELLDGETARRIGWICPYACNVRPMSGQVRAAAALAPDGRTVAISHPAGAGVWDTTTGDLRFPLQDPYRPPLSELVR